jgi:hypothetical protein
MIGPADPLEWAKHPRSQAAMEVIARGAKENRQLRRLLEAHIQSGVCNEAGKLLSRWDGQKWRPVERPGR